MLFISVFSLLVTYAHGAQIEYDANMLTLFECPLPDCTPHLPLGDVHPEQLTWADVGTCFDSCVPESQRMGKARTNASDLFYPCFLIAKVVCECP